MEGTLSIIIASHNAEAVIERCLSALLQQTGSPSLDVIVADSSTDNTPDIVRTRFPGVRLLHFDDPLTIPALRGRGLATAAGEVIAIVDPFAIPDPDWASRVLAAHEHHPHQVIGGCVDLADPETASYGTWATYLNEYGLFMSPTMRGATGILPGTNISYKRNALFDDVSPRYPIFWKTYVNWAIERDGSPQWLEPEIRVTTRKPVGFGDFLRSRFHHGRCFAGMRVRDERTGIKILRAATTIAVPGLLLWRLTSTFWPKAKRRWRFAATVPAQLVLYTAWAVGEFCGYLTGTGRSCEHIYY